MKPEVKKLILLNLPYLLFVYLFGKVGQAFRLAQGIDLSAKLLHIGQGFTAAFSSAAPSFHPIDLLIGIAGAVIIRLVVYSKQKNAKKYRKGMEYGTARWGTPADIKPFIDPVFENNVLLTQTERLMMSNRPKDPKNARNKNILVIGGSGSGKTRFFAKPNIMQLHSSYVITDPKGSLICEVGQLLQRAKYRIKVLNTINFSKSMHYNPFAYLRSEKDILKLVNKSKVLFNLTKRQLICFGVAALMGVPLFFLLKDGAGTTAAAMVMILVMLPGFLFGVYEKNGQPLEVVLRQMIESCFIRPKERPYQTDNAYAALVRQYQMEKEVKAIVQGDKTRSGKRSDKA